ncbi:SRPBCC family protein [Azonexus sp.]|uniref:SRPBCC family protein n=1 Tax=Azonexus sp. TaxID=1872668 RepID=UPI0035B3F836
MKFEHLIVINDPGNPLIVPLNRRQLWEGLLQRVYHPLPFLPGLESCTLLQRDEAFLRRELDFGAARIRDRVTLAVEEWVHFEIEPGEQHPGGSLTIRIEEPAPEQLCLRFIYTTAMAAEDQAYIEYVKSAYQQSDIDCVSIIRTLAAGGTCQ